MLECGCPCRRCARGRCDAAPGGAFRSRHVPSTRRSAPAPRSRHQAGTAGQALPLARAHAAAAGRARRSTAQSLRAAAGRSPLSLAWRAATRRRTSVARRRGVPPTHAVPSSLEDAGHADQVEAHVELAAQALAHDVHRQPRARLGVGPGVGDLGFAQPAAVEKRQRLERVGRGWPRTPVAARDRGRSSSPLPQ